MFIVEVLTCKEMATQPADSTSEYIKEDNSKFFKEREKAYSQGFTPKIRIIYARVKTWLQSYLENNILFKKKNHKN